MVGAAVPAVVCHSRLGLTRCGTVSPSSVVVGTAVPAAVRCCGLCPHCPGVGRCLSGVDRSVVADAQNASPSAVAMAARCCGPNRSSRGEAWARAHLRGGKNSFTNSSYFTRTCTESTTVVHCKLPRRTLARPNRSSMREAWASAHLIRDRISFKKSLETQV